MRDMTAGKLKYSFPTESVFQRFFTHCALGSDKRSLASGSRPLRIKDSCHGPPRSREERALRGLRMGVDGVMTEAGATGDRKSTRLNSSHLVNSYAVFCL